jgi:hypothetical protein
MKTVEDLQLFNSQKIRTHWDSEEELWNFSIIDIVLVLTQSNNPRRYWNDLKTKLKSEGSELSENITKAWRGHSVKEYKELKDLKKENLRDNMTNLELVLNMLAEATTTEISKETNPDGFEEHKNTALQGGEVAGDTRKAIELKTGKKIVSKQNAKKLLK